VAGGEQPGASRRAVPRGGMTPPPGICENCYRCWLATQSPNRVRRRFIAGTARASHDVPYTWQGVS
jgi:hypothetical protein